MKIIILALLLLSLSQLHAGCFNSASDLDVEACKSNNTVGQIYYCLNGMQMIINSCKQELMRKQVDLKTRREQLQHDEALMIEKAAIKLTATGLGEKQNARYLALQNLLEDFTNYSDNLKNAIAKTNASYTELRNLKLAGLSEDEKAKKVLDMQKIIKRINNESSNAQAYFNEYKPKFLAEEALLNLKIVESAFLAVQNLKKQNDTVSKMAEEVIDEIRPKTSSNEAVEINFPSSFEKLVRESENQDLLLQSCAQNASKNCKTFKKINEAYHQEVSQRISISSSEVASMSNLALRNKILEAKKNDDLIEYGRLYDLAKAVGDIK